MDLSLFVVFVLAAFLGVELISKVPATLHTPLMSGSNAISGITIVGAILIVGATGAPWAKWVGFAALVLATVNVVGGFLVTDRMLEMFKPREATRPGTEAGTNGTSS
ncbi:MAG: NAD(P) transhydrogenase subunit alpha [Bacteroidota bacterium]